ncbi:type II toxin-antitoxin system Phd/YefM family antitoxin [Acaryochloris marina]|uniref:Antitoxin n=1 Tax=Acaryochloris marina (strain MBIC 11017) TaxID=329726 RepID=B0C6Q4_ACAM1|nr:type II toxin-antitoxin system Phd/YefM family antitoxin [Acaryochloris marina]ABW27610.1 addiction module antitoxin, Axe family protein, putative [Acaryochloris marina MBIC11017]BDM82344.1 hypothetical protein AM10699_52080 [Acaryochloris marina MBIC10699]
MDSISVNQFRAALKECVEKVISQHDPLKVTRRNGADFVVVSAEDWEREQETLRILQSSDLMQQISESFATHLNQQGYTPSTEEMDEIFSL